MGRGRSGATLAGARLPVELTSFVGRREQVRTVKRLLGSARMVTLVGPGGVGKTRLALRVAAEVHRAFPDGVWLAELAGLRDPDLLATTVSAALGMCDGSVLNTPGDCLEKYLAGKHLLLVLDNAEHLSSACAHLVGRLLVAAPKLRVLVTSREPLQIGAEQVWPVPALSVPGKNDKDAVGGLGGHYEALTLFADRAAKVMPGFTLNPGNAEAVAEICRRLDGLPLAIELAAWWLRVLSPEQILDRLPDRFAFLTAGDQTAPPRHQTLRAAAEWSYDLCDDLEQTLWARLSVFTGAFDLDLAQAVCVGEGVIEPEVFTGVAGLLGKSILVRAGDGSTARYQMLETIRQYGAERLAADGEADRLHRRHRDTIGALAERVAQEWCGPDHRHWYTYLHNHHADLRAALRLCLTEPGGAHTVLQIACAAGDYWVWYGLSGEGRRWLDQALALDDAPTPTRIRALWLAARLAVMQGDMDEAEARVRECDALARPAGDAEALAHLDEIRGLAAFFTGDHPRARDQLETAVQEYQRAGEAAAGACLLALYELALVHCVLGDDATAIELVDRSQAMAAARGTEAYRFVGLAVLGYVQFRRGDLRQAGELVKESLRIQRAGGEMQGTAQSLEVLAWITAGQDRHQHAAELLGAANRLWRQLSTTMPDLSPYGHYHQRVHDQLGQTLGDQAFHDAWQGGWRLSLEQSIACALEETAPDATASPTRPVLTPRQHQVAQLVAAGRTNKQIAEALVISPRTAEGHVEETLIKLGFANRAELASWATRRATDLSTRRIRHPGSSVTYRSARCPGSLPAPAVRSGRTGNINTGDRTGVASW